MKVDGPWSQPSITLVACYVAIIRLPTYLYLYLAHPDWSWMYLVDPDRIPWPIIVSIVAASIGMTASGYYGGVRMVKALKEKIVLAVLGGTALVLAIVFILVRGRLLSYGSYEQFHAGYALPLRQVKLGYVLVAVVIGVLAAVAFVGWELYRDGRRAASR